jgi:sugar transferase (PEP-CTERM/EpsH1 system associated)
MADILFLAHRVPYPPDRGDKIRSWHILKALCEIADVHVAALCDDSRDMAHLRFLNRHAATVAVFPRNMARDEAALMALLFGGSASVRAFANRDLRAYVQDVLHEQDIKTIFAFSGQMGQYVPSDFGTRRFVMDFVDMDSAKYAEWGRGNGLAGLANRFEARRLLAFETSTACRAHVSTFVSAAEADLFRETTGLSADKVQVLENGIDLAYYTPVAADIAAPSARVVFTGQMDYAPNVDAVCDFVRDVWPLVCQARPDATLSIVGRKPTPQVLELASDRVIVTGEVPDTRPWLADAAVVIAPLKLARGVQNKVLEAMAMARPVVASSAAAQGIDAVAGRDLLVVDAPDAQAAAIVHLLNNPADRTKVGLAARARMVERYGWEAQLAGLRALVGFQ